MARHPEMLLQLFLFRGLLCIAGVPPIGYNPSPNGTGFYYSTDGSAPTSADPFTSSVSGGATLTTLPSALPLFPGGAALIGLLIRRRKQANTIVTA
jgi:hypothetical protein